MVKGFSLKDTVPVYVLTGDDSYTKKQICDKIKQKLTDEYSCCDTIVLDGKEVPYQRIIDDTSTPSLLCPAGLIIVRRADNLISNKEFRKFIEEYAAKESYANTLVIECEKKVTSRKFTVVSLPAPYENRLPDWIKNYIEKKGKRIDDDAANLLAFYCGRNLHNITSEIDKLVISFPDKKAISIEEIRQVAGTHKKDDVFRYLTELESGSTRKALVILENMIRYGIEPLQVTGMLRWKLQQMITARSMMNKGVPEAVIIKSMKLSPYYYRGFTSKLRRFSIQKLSDSYHRLVEIDRKMKTSSADKSYLLEDFTFRF